nr:zinc finger protein zic 2-b [Quercus suber]
MVEMTDKADSFMGLGPRDTIDPSLLAMNKHLDSSMWNPHTTEANTILSPGGEIAKDNTFNVASNSHSILETETSSGLAAGLHLPTYNSRCDDSDCSWDEDDDQGDWNANMQSTLRALVGTHDGFLLSDLLPKRQRRLVHAMATVLQLNHVTLGKGKDRSVLVSKKRISPTLNGRPRPRCWNRTARPTEEYDVILPEQISISGVSCQTTMEQLVSSLASQASSAPLRTDWLNSGGHLIACLDFATPEDAAMVVSAVASFAVMEPSTLKATYRTAKITQAVYEPTQPTQPTQQPLSSPTGSMHQTPMKRPISMRRGSEQFASLDTLSIYSSSKHSTQASSVDPAGYTSGDSATTMRSVYSGHSSLRPSRRRRLPASTAGYMCRADDCTRTFNRAGDRTKHERVHFPNAQSHPYECKRCSKTFMYPKDLRRHEAIHERGEQPSVSHPRNNPAAGANLSWCMRVDASTGGACKAMFMDREHEREHLRTSHGLGADKFICPVCSYGGYSLRSDLLEHLCLSDDAIRTKLRAGRFVEALTLSHTVTIVASQGKTKNRGCNCSSSHITAATPSPTLALCPRTEAALRARRGIDVGSEQSVLRQAL